MEWQSLRYSRSLAPQAPWSQQIALSVLHLRGRGIGEEKDVSLLETAAAADGEGFSGDLDNLETHKQKILKVILKILEVGWCWHTVGRECDTRWLHFDDYSDLGHGPC